MPNNIRMQVNHRLLATHTMISKMGSCFRAGGTPTRLIADTKVQYPYSPKLLIALHLSIKAQTQIKHKP